MFPLGVLWLQYSPSVVKCLLDDYGGDLGLCPVIFLRLWPNFGLGRYMR